jgi:hypothetical protein
MSDAAHMLKELNEDRALASAVIFPHRHKQVSPQFHIDMTDLWRSMDEFVVIEAFRQGAKTTVAEEFILLEALFGNFHYALIFGETYTKACQRIAGMKHELLTNLSIAHLFGKQQSKTATENKLILGNNVCIEAHGWEEEIRGYLHLDHRPDRAYLDDIETEERVRDTQTVDKNWRKLYKQLLPAMDKDNRKIRMTGTPLADDCMIVRAQNSPNWTGGKFPICDRDPADPLAQSLWPERYPMEWIRAEKARFEEQGMLREFMQEYMLIAAGAAGKPFEESMLSFEEVAPQAYSPRIVIMDPARTADPTKSDHTGFVVVSRVGSRIFVHASGGRFWQPDEIVNGAFDLAEEFDDAEVAIEKNSLDNWLLQPMRAQMLRLGKTLKLKLLNAPQDRDKIQFIMGLKPFFMGGDIVLIGGRSKHPQLVSQLLNFPTGKKDVINALAYAQRVFSGVAVYGDFSQHNIRDTAPVPRSATLLLGANATGSETCCVLVSLDGPFITVLRDWNSPLMPNEAIPEVAMMLRAAYPGRAIQAWVPADIAEQVGRNPLIAALKQAQLKPATGDHIVMARGSLSTQLRTEMRGKRLLTVDSQARGTMQAFASGYNWPLKPNGERAPEPERNSARTLMEALEVLTYAINKQDTAGNNFKPNATNTNGVPYMSALSRG